MGCLCGKGRRLARGEEALRGLSGSWRAEKRGEMGAWSSCQGAWKDLSSWLLSMGWWESDVSSDLVLSGRS